MENGTKLLINLKEGIVQVEGTEEFVRDVYNDFKERVSKPVVFQPTPPRLEQLTETTQSEDEAEVSRKSGKARVRRQPSTTGKSGDAVAYKPKFNSDLDVLGAGLAEYYKKYAPKNNNEKIVVFAGFLRDQMGRNPCTADDIYTCYFTMKDKIPEAYLQAFYTCQSRTHYIKFTSPTEIEVAIPGNNYLNANAGGAAT